ncbi:spermidine synthase [Nocardiopsis sp. RSe5-2]|uniref:Spermidine synthase n=1 Tax=Nocardiopsis endophytica TaxID=3018445 RepID=A0ABT4U617_9ACTN|nr:spermidine synthase [Nocardiopsis endophytica]MDA2811895.1 spermidine synthase [Nocardiopsis endophytica]
MSRRFQVLDLRPTPIGDISLRRRLDPVLGREVHEIKLGDEFLMSSAFTAAEEEMSRLALAEPGLTPGGSGRGLRVAVGGLGLGFTAQTALEDDRVGALVVIEALGEVIDWHKEGLIPAGAVLSADDRCTFVHGDFFAIARGDEEPDALKGDAGAFDVVLLDVDHSPEHVLNPEHSAFYTTEGLAAFARRMLAGGGVFALWSNDPPDDGFTARLGEVFAAARAEEVRFPNPLQGGESSNTVYIAARPREAAGT